MPAMVDSRQGLLAEVLEKLDRFDESVPIRRVMFERTLSDYYLDLWLKHRAEPARTAAIARARELALAHTDPVRAATALLNLGDAEAAENKLLAGPGLRPRLRHAARYWARLREIANSGVNLLPLSSPGAFEAEIRARHARKTAFWAHVNGTRRDRHDVEDDE
jgi:hypothetical protein